MKKPALLIIIIITSVIVTSLLFSISIEGGNFEKLTQLDGNYTLIITPESSKIARGDDLTIYWGLQRTENGSITYVPGILINFTLSFVNSSKLQEIYSWNATSSSILSEYTISFVYLKEPGNYVINGSTIINQEELNSSTSFSVIISPLPKINLIIPSSVYLRPNVTTTIKIAILNLGGTTARNLTISLSVLDSYPPLEMSNTLPSFVDKLEPSPADEIKASINATILDFGETVIQLLVSYWSIDGVNYINPFTINVYSIPGVFLSLSPPQHIYKDKENKLSLKLYNNENKAIQLSLELQGENISFSSDKILVLLPSQRQTIVNIFITGLAEGLTDLQINLVLIEDKSRQELSIARYSFPLFVDTFPSKENNGKNSIIGFLRQPQIMFPLLFSFIFIFLALALIDKYYGISNLIRKILPLTIPVSHYGMANKPFNYNSKVVVVDGSNVAWEEKDEKNRPKADNLKRIIEVLSQAGFEEIIVLADASLRHQIDNVYELDRLVKMGIVKFLPAKVKGDQLLLRLAEEKNAYILSNDLFKEFRDTYEWIDERRIPFTIIQGQAYLHPTYIIKREKEKEKENTEKEKRDIDNRKDNNQ